MTFKPTTLDSRVRGSDEDAGTHESRASPNPVAIATTTSDTGSRVLTARVPWWRPRPAFVIALAASIAVHLAISLWPAELPTTPPFAPLAVTITELPPPPLPEPAPRPAKPAKPKPKRATPAPPPLPPAPIAEESPATIAEATPPPDATSSAAETTASAPEFAPEPAPIEPPPVVLPPRVDLAYKVFLGTQGFLIGEAVYRFEHDGSQYRIETVGEARGLAALLLHGQGRLESRGMITPAGLQPLEFAVERGSRERREVAHFDWETGLVTLHEDKTLALELPTFDPLALMWQFYFAPPTTDEQSFYVATTRRVQRYTATREALETIPWRDGELVTERWHRRSDDGKTDGYAWLAPSLRYVPVKVRLNGPRGTLEALLDAIRVDEPLATK